jgi:hypothetical protein
MSLFTRYSSISFPRLWQQTDSTGIASQVDIDDLQEAVSPDTDQTTFNDITNIDSEGAGPFPADEPLHQGDIATEILKEASLAQVIADGQEPEGIIDDERTAFIV